MTRRARHTVGRTIRALPPSVRARAQEVPVLLLKAPTLAMRADHIEPDTLGLFVGPSYAEEAAPMPTPPRILLFLQNLWDCSEGRWPEFQRQVRITLLHELGHYLNWDEEDLSLRGLE